jgi:hypothetical protein
MGSRAPSTPSARGAGEPRVRVARIAGAARAGVPRSRVGWLLRSFGLGAFVVASLMPGLARGNDASVARAGADDASSDCGDDLEGCYLGRDGRIRNAAAAYAMLLGDPDPAYLRASIEMVLSLGIGTAWYWIDRERNLADWDYPSLKQRFSTEVWRYDNNSFSINKIFHPLSGTAWYALARGNEISVPWAAAYSFLTSLTWEYVLEFREKISINDVLVTPGAGIAIGEFAHKLALYLNSAPAGGRWLLQALRWAFGWTVAGHRAIDGVSVEEPNERDALGLDASIWHHFRFAYRSQLQTAGGDHASPVHSFGFGGELVSIPGFLRPGRFGRGLRSADFTELDLSLMLASGQSGLNLYADTTLVGYYHQRIDQRSDGAWGYGVLLGSSIAYRYLNQRIPFRDRLATLHLPGLAVNLYALLGPLQLRLKLRARFDFAGVHASLFDAWREANPDEVPKSILKKQQYYYGWGGSTRASLDIKFWLFELGGSVSYGAYDSDEGLDRTQADVTADVKGSDTVLEYAAWLRTRLGQTRLHVEVGLNGRRRGADLGGLSGTIRDDRYTLGLMLQL